MLTSIATSRRLILVTGPSGAGRSTALNAFEDLGFETIDNLPISLVPKLLDEEASERTVALGIDVRTRGFSPVGLLDLLSEIAQRNNSTPDLLFLDAAPDVLMTRYSETRRRHPLALDGAPDIGISRELELLAPLRDQATILINTSDLSPHDLRLELHRIFESKSSLGMTVSVQSFAFKRGLPRSADAVFDCRFLSNPHWQPSLRPLTGRDRAVASYVAEDPRFPVFYDKLLDLLQFQLPAARDEGKTHFAVAVGCTGGKHRSVALAEALGNGLAQSGWQVSIRHRELEHHTRVPNEDSIPAKAATNENGDRLT